MLVLLKGMLDSKRMHANEQLNTIVIRDQPEAEMAEKIILANDRLDSEVLFGVEVWKSIGPSIKPTASRIRNKWPRPWCRQVLRKPSPATWPSNLPSNNCRASEKACTLKLPTNVQQDSFKQITDAKTLAAPKVRVVNNKKAEINIGDKQPILLSTTNVLPARRRRAPSRRLRRSPPSRSGTPAYKLTVEPAIHSGNELTLKMKIEVIRLGEQVTLQANPPITQFKFGNRSAETMLNVKDGETIVLGGLIQEEDRRTRVTIPWLGDLPLIGNLISSFKTQRVTTEVILTLTPHIVQAMTPPSLSRQAFWSGTDSTYSNSTMFTPHPKTSLTSVNGINGSSTKFSAQAQRGVAGRRRLPPH